MRILVARPSASSMPPWRASSGRPHWKRRAVSPPWVTETLVALKMDHAQGLPAAVVARSYVESVTGQA